MKSSPPPFRTFQCMQQAGTESWLISFNDNFAFQAISSRSDLDSMFLRYSTVVLLGVFDWSNYSREVFAEMAAKDDWFVEKKTGIGVLCLGNPSQRESINREAYEQYLKQNTEPMLFRFNSGILKDTIAGPKPIADIQRWILAEA